MGIPQLALPRFTGACTCCGRTTSTSSRRWLNNSHLFRDQCRYGRAVTRSRRDEGGRSWAAWSTGAANPNTPAIAFPFPDVRRTQTSRLVVAAVHLAEGRPPLSRVHRDSRNYVHRTTHISKLPPKKSPVSLSRSSCVPSILESAILLFPQEETSGSEVAAAARPRWNPR